MTASLQIDLTSVGLCALCAWGLLRLWQAGGRERSLWQKVTPWAGIMLTLTLWSWSVGPEFATVYTLLFTTLFVWLLILRQQFKGTRQSPRSAANQAQKPTRPAFAVKDRQLWAKLSVFMVAGPLACVACVMLCVSLLPMLPLSEASSLVLMAFVFPVLWAVAAVWACADVKAWRPPVALFSVGLGAYFTLFI